MTTEQVVQLLVAGSITIYRDEIKTFLNARFRSFRKARTEDFNALRRRHLGPYVEKHHCPDPLFRETLATLVTLGSCLLVFYLVDRFGHKQDLASVTASWVAKTISLAAIMRMLLLQTLFVGYRTKLLWEKISGASLHSAEECQNRG